MLPVTDALHEIFSRATQLGPERVSLPAALGRTLRSAARADADSPPFDAAAMDGYALRRAEASTPLRVIGTSAAGTAFTGSLRAAECVRIFTGAPVPAHTDCVIKQEDVARDGDTIRVIHADGPAFIRRRGENRRCGDVVVPAGTRLGPPELAALAGAGITEPEVTRAPRCVHLVTGNELVDPDQTPNGAQIRDSNSTLIAALLSQHGAELIAQIRVPDDLAAARATLAALPAHDLLLISGGASVGDHDIARPLLEALGFNLHFQQINLRPGKPLVFASRGITLAFALPGNPVSHWVTFHLFIAPLLGKLASGIDSPPVKLSGRLAANCRLPSADSRQTIWPARVTPINGTYEITPLLLASSGDSSGLVGANALLPLPANGLDPAQPVEFIPCN